jgi:hypothetical protein
LIRCAFEVTSGLGPLDIQTVITRTVQAELPFFVRPAKMISPSVYGMLAYVILATGEIATQDLKDQLGKMPVCAVRIAKVLCM